MFTFFDQIGNLIGSVVGFVVTLFKQLVSFFQILYASLMFVIEVCAVLPGPVKAGCLAVVSICVIFLIVNR